MKHKPYEDIGGTWIHIDIVDKVLRKYAKYCRGKKVSFTLKEVSILKGLYAGIEDKLRFSLELTTVEIAFLFGLSGHRVAIWTINNILNKLRKSKDVNKLHKESYD